MLDALITSKTRIRILVKFFLNPAVSSYLRELSDEFGESTNGVRVELNRLTKAGLLISEINGKTVLYKAKKEHPLFDDIKNLVSKYVGIDKIVDDIAKKLGKLESVYVFGDYAKGKDTGVVDLIFIGNIDKAYLVYLIEKAEKLIKRKLRFLSFQSENLDGFETHIKAGPMILIWKTQTTNNIKNNE